MSLQDQGFRFILRGRGQEVEGNWEHPADIAPGGFDATDLTDEQLAAVLYDMQDGLNPKPACANCGGSGIERHHFHGVWPNGEECVEPIKCAECDGLGRATSAESDTSPR